MGERVRITVEFERPGNHTLEECAGLVRHQMKAKPRWDDPAGTGLLNYVCFDKTLDIVSATLSTKESGR